MIETWNQCLALVTAPSTELFAQAYQSPSLSSSSCFSLLAHSPETSMPSHAEKLGKAKRQWNKYLLHIYISYASWTKHIDAIQVDWTLHIISYYIMILWFLFILWQQIKDLFKDMIKTFSVALNFEYLRFPLHQCCIAHASGLGTKNCLLPVPRCSQLRLHALSAVERRWKALTSKGKLPIFVQNK